MSLAWRESLQPDSDYAWNPLAKGYLLIGVAWDENLSYEHCEHRIYAAPNEWVHVFSSGCSCWSSDDAVEEWRHRTTFTTKEELIAYIQQGDYQGLTLPSQVLDSIKKVVIPLTDDKVRMLHDLNEEKEN